MTTCPLAQTSQLTAQTVDKNQRPSSRTLTIQQKQADFDVLRSALKEAHGGLYRFTDSTVLNQRFDQYRSQLPFVKDQVGFISLLSAMLAEVRDGHMRLEYDGTTNEQLSNARLFPFRTILEGEKLMVAYNETPDNTTVIPGMEILSINGRKTSALVGEILARISGDGFIQTGKKRRFERSFAQNYWLFIDQSAEFTMIVKDKAGKETTVTVSGVPTSERVTNRTANRVNELMIKSANQLDVSKENIAVRFADDKKIAGIRIRGFDGQQFVATLDSVFLHLKNEKTKALILDLRGNGGGVDEYGAALVSQFTDKPFRYFDRIHLTSIAPSFATWKPRTFETLRKQTVPDPKGGYLVTTAMHSGVGEQQPAKNPFLGKVIVLMDGGTFSTSADVTATLRKLTNAAFIGEESGGTAEGNTSGLNALIKLPNSELGLKIQMFGYWNALVVREKGRGTLPDYPVETRIADLLEGQDKQWLQAVSLARRAIK
ncbi:S41 family peptidase [Spirosoma harenae]